MIRCTYFALCVVLFGAVRASLNIGYNNFSVVTHFAKNYISDRSIQFNPNPRGHGMQGPGFARTSLVLRSIECDACLVGVEALRLYVEMGKTEEEIVKLATAICIDFKIEDKHICTGICREFKDEFIGVIAGIALDPMEVCSFVVGDGCGNPFDPTQGWNVTLPSTKKPPIVPPVPPKKGAPKLRMLHLTDLHTDLGYIVGSNTNCGEPICCRTGDGTPAPGVRGAGKWGDERGGCDIPLRTLESLFQHLSTIKDEFDFAIITGDIPSHNVWNQSRSDQVNAMRLVTKMIIDYLPGKQVYFSVGNHESAPVNSFPPPFITGHDSIEWLYTALADAWGLWLPSETVPTIIHGAFYTTSPFPGFRIVAVNMNYCNNGNWWLMINNTDPAGQLQWLISVLQDAENAHEKVYILGHIPNGGGDCLQSFSWNYYKIINRYESTVVAQFFGHTHTDWFELFYDEETFKRPLSVCYLPGSVTTNPQYFPGYRIYELDGNYAKSSWQILNYDNYVLNLTMANQNDTVKWTHLYNAQSSYNMTSLYPSDWNNLIQRMNTDPKLLKTFITNKNKGQYEPCDEGCKKNLLCSLRTARSHDPHICDHM